ncbi:MAG: hypothetical protein AB7J13_15445, partial [Pyrinomonadaceae bacterium]
MDDIFKPKEGRRGVNKVFVGALIFAAIAVAAVVGVLSLRPPIDEQVSTILSQAHREGSAEFADLNKDIIISTNDKTV